VAPDLLEFVRRDVPRPLLVTAFAAALAALIAAGEVSNWDLFLRFLYHVPYGQADPLYGNDIGFYLFTVPA